MLCSRYSTGERWSVVGILSVKFVDIGADDDLLGRRERATVGVPESLDEKIYFYGVSKRRARPPAGICRCDVRTGFYFVYFLLSGG